MKNYIFIIWIAFFLISCASTNRIVEINDSYKEIKGIRLIQKPEASSSEKIGSFGGRNQYNLDSSFLFEITKNGQSSLIAEFKITTSVSTDELDSIMFLDLDNEKIKLVSVKYNFKQFDRSSSSSTVSTSVENKSTEKGEKSTQAEKPVKTTVTHTNSTENNSYLLMKREFVIPENLWISIANTEKIQYRLYLGNDGIDVKLNAGQTRKLKDFMSKALQIRDANLPPTPEGLKKL